jgi:peptide-methionine (S)-S-oxide reductase
MRFRTVLSATLALALSSVTVACSQSPTTHGPIPPPQTDVPLAKAPSRATAVFAGGCFWGTQAVFERVKGVLKTTAGYAGGSASTATYDQVGSETTGHAESVEIVYDPSKLTYGQLLRVFFTIHDPTTLNRQGPDVGTSYRSAIFYSTPEQKRLAEDYIAQLDSEHAWQHKIVTEVTPLKGFYAGEDYHQDYALKHPDNPYIMVCDRPKIATLKADYPDLYVPYKGE